MTTPHFKRKNFLFCKNHPQLQKNTQSILTDSYGLENNIHAFAKSEAEPRNSTNIQMANNTPLACFFIRSTRISKIKVKLPLYLSMVACNGKGFALCCVPFVAVFELITRYRPKASKLQAVTSFKFLQMELLAMIYLFLCVNRNSTTYQEQTLRIEASNANEARWKLPANYRLLCQTGRINPNHIPKNAINPTAYQGGIL